MSVTKIALLSLGSCALSGCALFDGGDEPAAANGIPLAAGSYGLADDIRATVAMVKARGRASRLTRHAMVLPSQPTESIRSYELELPAECGGYAFRVHETGATRILEYRHRLQNGTDVVVRDYLADANPFVTPGLWTAYDHIEDEIPAMMAQLVRTSSAVMPRYYSSGLMTSLDEPEQEALGAEYRRATESRACG